VERRRFLKGLGLVAAGSVLPFRSQAAAWMGVNPKRAPACWLTPQETEGPFYFDPNLVRRDITEGKTGLPLHLTLTVMDDDCGPIPNVLVDIWHCDKDGLYSGYNQPAGDTTGQTFLRGIQMTDATGITRFDTIYPGWYQGRATHIHFKARTSQTTYITSQFAFPESVNDAVYATPLYAARGTNPTSNAADMVFHTSTPQYLLLDVSPDGNGGYNGAFAMGVSVPTKTRKNTWGEIKGRYPSKTI
jgi:protocatechuate 3,4-dioxygenase beta subunit